MQSKKVYVIPMIIKTTKKLEDLCLRLEKERFITVDTEFIREKTYYPVLCLIQVGAGKNAWCIDPLSPEMDLSPFFNILMNKNIIKVFHACHQDLEIFYHLMHKMPVPVFDTQVGAMVCGYHDNISYQQLVKDYTHITLDKGMRITDWAHRPLTKDQEKYALHDVIELKEVYQKMMQDICTHNRLDWIQEEMMHLTNTQNYELDIFHLMTKMHVPFHKKETIHLCARLIEWREKMAQKKDRPRKFILTDEALLECAALTPKTPQELEGLRGICEGFSQSEVGKSLMTCLQKSIQEEPLEWSVPQKQVLSSGKKSWLEALKLLLNIVCDTQKVAPYLVASNEALIQYINTNDAPFMHGWRFQIFGKHVDAFKNGEVAFVYDRGQKRLILQSNPTKPVQ